MRSNSSTAMSATAGSTRSRSANSDQNWLSIRAAAEASGAAGRARAAAARTIGCQSRRTNATAGHSSASAADALGVLEPELDRHAAAHRVADHVRALDPHRVHRAEHGAGEERRVVGRQRRLRGAAEARQVERVDAVAPAQRRRRVEERGLGAPSPCSSSMSGPSPIVSVERRRRPDGHVVDAQQRRAAVGEPEQALEGRRARSSSPRAYRRRWENASTPESSPWRSASQVAASVPIDDVRPPARRAHAHARAVACVQRTSHVWPTSPRRTW